PPEGGDGVDELMRWYASAQLGEHYTR
ncbi:cupin fold metalloprotein, WbuC family, partial [Serratia odorifera]